MEIAASTGGFADSLWLLDVVSGAAS